LERLNLNKCCYFVEFSLQKTSQIVLKFDSTEAGR